MFVFGFFPIPLSHATKKMVIFSVLFVAVSHWDKKIVLFFALSHGNKKIFCLLHWVTVTKKLVYVAGGKKTKKGTKMLHFWYFLPFLALFVTFLHFVCPFPYFFKRIYTLWHFLCNIYQFCLSQRQTKNPFVAVTQCNKQNKSLSQWLSATNNILKKKSNIFVAWDKGIGKKAKNKHPLKFEFYHRYQITLGYFLLHFWDEYHFKNINDCHKSG